MDGPPDLFGVVYAVLEELESRQAGSQPGGGGCLTAIPGVWGIVSTSYSKLVRACLARVLHRENSEDYGRYMDLAILDYQEATGAGRTDAEQAITLLLNHVIQRGPAAANALVNWFGDVRPYQDGHHIPDDLGGARNPSCSSRSSPSNPGSIGLSPTATSALAEDRRSGNYGFTRCGTR